MEIVANNLWNKSHKRVSIITPVFNRREELKRAIDSVKQQTYKDFEYIIVNDGSTIDIDDIVKKLMESELFPVLYIKKSNGGVHTARNAAIKYCRGEMIFPLDSDDEMLPNSLEVLIKHWDSIPNENKKEYREICARCCDQNKKEVGALFPKDINDYSLKKSHRIASKCKCEHLGFWRADIMKANPWPEPKGITLVNEGLLWDKLTKKYKSFYVNDVVRVYHLEDNDSYTRNKVLTIQNIKNKNYRFIYLLNNNLFHGLIKNIVFAIATNCILHRRNILKNSIMLKHLFHKFVYIVLFLPSWLFSIYYEKKKMQ